jgi:hypothetical protein
VAHLYRLAVENTGPGMTTYHAVQEEGVSLRDIAETISSALGVPLVSIPAEKAGEPKRPSKAREGSLCGRLPIPANVGCSRLVDSRARPVTQAIYQQFDHSARIGGLFPVWSVA